MSTEAKKAPCEECHHPADPVHRATDDEGNALDKPVFKGWCCANCGHLTTPIRREHGLEMPT